MQPKYLHCEQKFHTARNVKLAYKNQRLGNETGKFRLKKKRESIFTEEESVTGTIYQAQKIVFLWEFFLFGFLWFWGFFCLFVYLFLHWILPLLLKQFFFHTCVPVQANH